MSTQPGGAQPPAQDSPSGEQPSTQTAEATIEDLDRFLENADAEQLDAILNRPAEQEGDKPPPAAPEEDQPGQDADESPPAEPEPEPEPEPDPPEEEDQEHPGEEPDNPSLDQPNSPPQRIRLTNVPDAERAALAQIAEELRQGKSLDEILKSRVTAPPPEDRDEPEPDPPEARPDTQSPELSEIQARIEQRKEAFKQAVAEYDEEAKADILLELQDLKMELAESRRQAAAHQQQQAAYSRQFQQNVQALRSRFPDLNDENSAMSTRLGELRDLAEVRSPEIQSDPDFILRLAQQAVKDVGAATPSGEPKKAPVPAPQPARQARPVGEVAGASPPVGSSVRSATAVPDFDRMMETMSDADKDEFLNQVLNIPD